MSEARDRRLQQFSSSIFGESQPRAVTPQPARSQFNDASPSRSRAPVESDSFRSTVFAPPDPPQRRYNPHKPNDHYPGDFYEVARRTGEERHREPTPEFEPKYKYEQKVVRKEPPQRVDDREEKSARERKGDQMSSHVFDGRQVHFPQNPGMDEAMYKASFKWTDSRSEMMKRDQRQLPPDERRRLEAESSVFGPSEPRKQNGDIQREQYERPIDRNYSDLFGREFAQPKTAPRTSQPPSSANWKDSRYEAKPQLYDDYSPSHFRDQQLRSAFDPPRSESSCTQQREEPQYSAPQNPRQMKQYNLNQYDVGELPRPDEAQVETFIIRGLKPTDDVQTVKQLCKGLHVVSIETEVDDIQGRCTGQAKVAVRHFPGSSTTDKLRVSVVDAGLEISAHTPDLKKKNNYSELAGRSFLDHQMQQEEKRLGGDAMDPKQSKMRLLESSADVYGSSPGVGRWPAEWKRNGKPQDSTLDSNTRAQIHQWEGVKKGRSQTPNAVLSVRAESSFLQPTESSKNRARA